MRNVLVLGIILIAAAAISVPSAMRCPDIADAHVATGWQEYRAGRLGNAQSAFASARVRCPNHLDSQVGIGYIALRNMSFDSARTVLRRVLREKPRHVDAMVGLGIVEWRVEEYDTARALFNRALALDSGRADVRRHLTMLPPPLGPAPIRPPLVLSDSVLYNARVNGTMFEVRGEGGWAPFYIKGVNLGAALPGNHPSEFPDGATYAAWLREMAAMGINTVRVYTLHPPEFYEALAAHNAAHPSSPLWLIQGVWAELPPQDEYDAPSWQGEFFTDMERAIDALHGRADVKHRAGRAAGHYTADVSAWTLGLIIGREWEPFSVAEYNLKRPQSKTFRGRYLAIENTTPMDVWLTRAMEHVIAYETSQYRQQRPVAYTNWPTLDPMHHDTELDVQKELTIRGVQFDRTRRHHNEDEVSLGAQPVQATENFRAGYFAAFHVYPYYPDFFLHDRGYAQVQSPFGASSYYGYLLDLKRNYADVPVVIAEYGVPASWGIAHFNPQGMHHGGHTEAKMADLTVRLTREIQASGMAGGIMFSWIDEWFKHNWLLDPFEQPTERNRMWWNRMNPEQHYGVLALEPVRRLGETLVDRRAAWDTIPVLYSSPDGTRFRAHADEAYLWLHVSGPGHRAKQVFVGFDIVDPAGGGMRFPGAGAPLSPVGLELVLQLDSSSARLLATPRAQQFRLQELPRGTTARDYQTPVANTPPGFFTGSYSQVLNEPFEPRVRTDGRFDPLYVAVNRARVGADSTNYFGFGYDRGTLPEGPLPDGAWERAWWADAVEVRIPWNLLNVTDPSSRHVVFEDKRARPDDVVGTRQVEAIRIVAATVTDGGAWRVWPETGKRADAASFTWQTWDEPSYRMRRRPVFNAMRNVFREMGAAVALKANQP